MSGDASAHALTSRPGMRVRASKRADAGSQEQLGLSVEQSEGNDGTISAAPYGVRFPARSDV